MEEGQSRLVKKRRPFLQPLLYGLVPLVVGVSVWALWRVNRAPTLMVIGLWVIGVGVPVSVLGAGAWIVDTYRLWRDPAPWPSGAKRRAILAAVFLFGCYPAALAIVADVDWVLTHYRVAIENDSPAQLESCRVLGGGVDLELGAIPPGGSREVVFRVQQEGTLRCVYQHGEAEKDVLLDGYVMPSSGGDMILSVDGAGQPTVRQLPR